MPGEKESPKTTWDANAILDGTMWDKLPKEIKLSQDDKGHIEDIKDAVRVYHDGLGEFDELYDRYSKLEKSGVARESLEACGEILSRLTKKDIEKFRETFEANCKKVDGKEKIGARALDFTVNRLFHALADGTNGAIYSIGDNLNRLRRELDKIERIERIEKLAIEGHIGELNTDEFMYLLVNKKLPDKIYKKHKDKIDRINNGLSRLDVAKQTFSEQKPQVQKLLEENEDVLQFVNDIKSLKTLYDQAWKKFSTYSEFVKEYDRVKKKLLETPMFDSSSTYATEDSIKKIMEEVTPLWNKCNEISEINLKTEYDQLCAVIKEAKKLEKADETKESKEEEEMANIVLNKLWTTARGRSTIASLGGTGQSQKDNRPAFKELCELHNEYEGLDARKKKILKLWENLGELLDAHDPVEVKKYNLANSDVNKEKSNADKEKQIFDTLLIEDKQAKPIETQINILKDAISRVNKAFKLLCDKIFEGFNKIVVDGDSKAKNLENLDDKMEKYISALTMCYKRQMTMAELIGYLKAKEETFPIGSETDAKLFKDSWQKEYSDLLGIYKKWVETSDFLNSRYDAWILLDEKRREIKLLESILGVSDGDTDYNTFDERIHQNQRTLAEYSKELEQLGNDTNKKDNVIKCISKLKDTLSRFNDAMGDKDGGEGFCGTAKEALSKFYKGDLGKADLQFIRDYALNDMQSKVDELKEKIKEQGKEKEALETQLSSLRKQNDEQKRNLDAKMEEIGKLKQEAEKRKTESEAQIAELQKKIETEEGQQKEELEKKEEELQGVRGELQKTQESFESQAKDLEAERKTLEKKENEISELKKQIDGLKTGAAGKYKKIEEVSEQLNQLRKDLEEEKTASTEQAKELEKAKSALEKANANLEAATQERDTLKASLETEKSAKEKAEREAAELRGSLEKLHTEFSGKQAELGKKENELKTLQEEAKKKEAALNKEIQAITAEKEALGRGQSEQKKQFEAREQKLAVAKKDAEEAGKKLSGKEQELKEAKETLATQSAKVTELTDQLGKLEKSLKSKKIEATKANVELTILIEQFDALSKAKEELERKSAERESELDEIEKKLSEVISENQSLKDVIEGRRRVTHDIEVSAREKAEEARERAEEEIEKLKKEIQSGKGVSKMAELSVKELLEQIENYTYKGKETEEIKWLKEMVKEIKQIEEKKQAWEKDYEKYRNEVSKENEVYKQLKPLYEKFVSLYNEYNSEHNEINLSSIRTEEGKNATSYLMNGLYRKYTNLKKFYDEQNKKIDELIEQLKEEGKLVSMTGLDLFNAIMEDTLTDKQIKKDPSARKQVDSIREMVNYLNDSHIDKISERVEIVGEKYVKKEYDAFKKSIASFNLAKAFNNAGQNSVVFSERNKIIEHINTIYENIQEVYSELKQAEETLNKKINSTLANEYAKVSSQLAATSKEYYDKKAQLAKCRDKYAELNDKLTEETKQIEYLSAKINKLEKGTKKRRQLEEKEQAELEKLALLSQQMNRVNEQIHQINLDLSGGIFLQEGEKGADDKVAKAVRIPEAKKGLTKRWIDLSARRKELAQLLIDTGAASEAEKKVLRSEMSRQGQEFAKAKKEVERLKEGLKEIGVPTRWEAFKSKIGGEEGRVSRRARKKEVAEKKKEIAAAEERLKTEKLKAKHLRRDFDSLNATPEKVKKNKDSGDYKKLEKAVEEAQKKYDELKKRIFRKPGALRAAEKKLEEAKEAFYEYKKNHPTEPIKYNDGSKKFAQEFAAAVEKAEKEAEEERQNKKATKISTELGSSKEEKKKLAKEEKEEKSAQDKKYLKTYVQITNAVKLLRKEFPNGLPFLDQPDSKILRAVQREELRERDELGEVIEKKKEKPAEALNKYFEGNEQVNFLFRNLKTIFGDGGYIDELSNSPHSKQGRGFSQLRKETKVAYLQLIQNIKGIASKNKIQSIIDDIKKTDKQTPIKDMQKTLKDCCKTLKGEAEEIKDSAVLLFDESTEFLKKEWQGNDDSNSLLKLFRSKKHLKKIPEIIGQIAAGKEDLQQRYAALIEEEKRLDKELEEDPRTLQGSGLTKLASVAAEWVAAIGMLVPEPVTKGVLLVLSSTTKLGVKAVETFAPNISWSAKIKKLRDDLGGKLDGIAEVFKRLNECYDRIITAGSVNALDDQRMISEAISLIKGLVNHYLMLFDLECQRIRDDYTHLQSFRTSLVLHALSDAKGELAEFVGHVMDDRGYRTLGPKLRGVTPDQQALLGGR